MKTVLYGLNGATIDYIDRNDSLTDYIIVTTEGIEHFRDLSSISLDEFSDYNFEQIDKLIICSSFVSDITNSLLEHSFPLEKIFCYDTYKVEIASCSNIKREHIIKDDVLYAFYDLANNWVTFDSIAFCIIAEIERIKLGKKHIHFFIVPDHSCNSEFVGAYQSQPLGDKQWRIDHILKAAFSCIPSLLGISLLAFREEADLFASSGITCLPAEYSSSRMAAHFAHKELRCYFSEGYNLSVFRAPTPARNLVSSFLAANGKDKKTLVINLREYDIQSSRNSRLDDWARFLQQIDKDIYFPVVVRDFYKSTEQLPEAFDGICTFPAAAIDFAVRVALFEQAWLNMSITNGAYYITNFLPDVAAVTFVQLDNNNPCMSTGTWERSGYTIGEDAPLRDNKNQIIVWEDDSFEHICRAFSRITNQLDSQASIRE